MGNAITWFNYHALPAIGGNANNTPVFLTWGLRGYIGAGGRDEKCGLIREISNPGFPPQSHDRGSRNQNPARIGSIFRCFSQSLDEGKLQRIAITYMMTSQA